MLNKVTFDTHEIEFKHPEFNINELLSTQLKSWNTLAQLNKWIVPGLSEVEGVKVISEKLKELGVERSWHHPVFRIDNWGVYFDQSCVANTGRSATSKVF